MILRSKKLTEYEVGSTLSLHHSAGREMVQNFFNSLERMILEHNREQSIFNSMDTFQDELFVYGKY